MTDLTRHDPAASAYGYYRRYRCAFEREAERVRALMAACTPRPEPEPMRTVRRVEVRPGIFVFDSVDATAEDLRRACMNRVLP